MNLTLSENWYFITSPWWCTCEEGNAHGDPKCFPLNSEEMIFVPQIYGIPGQGRRPNDTDPDVADYMDTVLAYNEPNQPDQANISPEDAAFHYAQLAEKYKDKVNYRFGSRLQCVLKEFYSQYKNGIRSI